MHLEAQPHLLARHQAVVILQVLHQNQHPALQARCCQNRFKRLRKIRNQPPILTLIMLLLAVNN